MSVTTEQIRRRLDRQYVVVRSPGELDLDTAPAFADRLVRLADNTDIVVDLRDLRFCGSTGISMLLAVEEQVSERESSLTLSFPPPFFDRLLDLCGLSDHFRIRRPAHRRRRRIGGADPSRR